ncbi:hypothetical protein RR48_11812 [Papilio machaon]|uniref:Uncharacterized protein n=1 Tax=Papilio machaon TaxID=76193 RepID=A0A194QP64_PAPMA|nr:hypothetical protein RR48_11812 [Papilio machaon]
MVATASGSKQNEGKGRGGWRCEIPYGRATSRSFALALAYTRALKGKKGFLRKEQTVSLVTSLLRDHR